LAATGARQGAEGAAVRATRDRVALEYNGNGDTMDRSLRTTLMLGVAFTVASLPGFGAEEGSTDWLARDADAVVIGETLSGVQTGNSVALVLSVTRAIKGEVPVGARLDVSGQTRFSWTGDLQSKDYGLWFLKRAGDGWELMSVVPNSFALDAGCFVPLSKTASPGTVATDSPPATAGDRVALELVATLEQGYTSPTQLDTLAWAFNGLGRRPFVTGLCRILRANPDPELRFIGLTGMLTGPDETSALAEIADNVNLIPKLKVSAVLAISLCGIRSTDPAALLSLGRLSADPSTEGCAAMSLDFIHTRETLPFLARLLDSTDPKAREYAIQGLSRFVENLPIAEANDQITGKSHVPRGPSLYRTAETDRYSLANRWLGSDSDTEYIRFWKSWWASVKDELGSAPKAE
jgi:hypothetical protein